MINVPSKGEKILLVAQTGWGKTKLAKEIALRSVETEVEQKILVIDPTGDWLDGKTLESIAKNCDKLVVADPENISDIPGGKSAVIVKLQQRGDPLEEVKTLLSALDLIEKASKEGALIVIEELHAIMSRAEKVFKGTMLKKFAEKLFRAIDKASNNGLVIVASQTFTPIPEETLPEWHALVGKVINDEADKFDEKDKETLENLDFGEFYDFKEEAVVS